MASPLWFVFTSLKLIFVGIQLSDADVLECPPWFVNGIDRVISVNVWNKCYAVSSVELTWSGAKNFCSSKGGYLTVANSVQEDVLYLGEAGCWYIGLSRDAITGWRWLDDSPVTFEPWNVTASDPLGACAVRCNKPDHFLSDGSWLVQWIAESCNKKVKFICEYDQSLKVTQGPLVASPDSQPKATATVGRIPQRSFIGKNEKMKISRIAVRGYLIKDQPLFEKRAYAATMCSRFCQEPCQVFNYNTKTGQCRGFDDTNSEFKGVKNAAWEVWKFTLSD